MKKNGEDLTKFTKERFLEAAANRVPGLISNFCDSLLSAKERALKENKESAPFLTDDNLNTVLVDMFTAGTDPTQFSLRWVFLYLANHVDMQRRMREEVFEVVGDRMATHADKAQCHYLNAFLAESLRIRNLAPIGLTHATTSDTYLGNFKLAKGTPVQVHQWSILNDVRYWDQPEVFKPERFLDSDGHFVKKQNPAFIPFGIGRRICPGEKLAMADMTLFLIRFLQRTAGYSLVLSTGPGTGDFGSNPENHLALSFPKTYNVVLQKE